MSGKLFEAMPDVMNAKQLTEKEETGLKNVSTMDGFTFYRAVESFTFFCYNMIVFIKF